MSLHSPSSVCGGWPLYVSLLSLHSLSALGEVLALLPIRSFALFQPLPLSPPLLLSLSLPPSLPPRLALARLILLRLRRPRRRSSTTGRASWTASPWPPSALAPESVPPTSAQQTEPVLQTQAERRHPSLSGWTRNRAKKWGCPADIFKPTRLFRTPRSMATPRGRRRLGSNPRHPRRRMSLCPLGYSRGTAQGRLGRGSASARGRRGSGAARLAAGHGFRRRLRVGPRSRISPPSAATMIFVRSA